MTTLDVASLGRLLELVWAAIAEQEPATADQLGAAMREGATSFEAVEREDATVLLVKVGGYAVAEVDVRMLVPLDDL